MKKIKPELGLLGEESKLPGLDQNGYEHRLMAAFIQNNYEVSIISDRNIIWISKGEDTFLPMTQDHSDQLMSNKSGRRHKKCICRQLFYLFCQLS